MAVTAAPSICYETYLLYILTLLKFSFYLLIQNFSFIISSWSIGAHVRGCKRSKTAVSQPHFIAFNHWQCSPFYHSICDDILLACPTMPNLTGHKWVPHAHMPRSIVDIDSQDLTKSCHRDQWQIRSRRTRSMVYTSVNWGVVHLQRPGVTPVLTTYESTRSCFYIRALVQF